MRQPNFRGFTLHELIATAAVCAALSFALHPVLAQARTDSLNPKVFRQDKAFQLYASDVDGGSGDFLGKPVLLDGLGESLARYNDKPLAHCAAKHNPVTGCMPITQFQPSMSVVDAGTATFWDGKMSNASSGACSVSAYSSDPVLAVPNWGSVPVAPNGTFWLMAGALQQGVGTLEVQTNTGATAANSILVLD